MKRNLNDLLVVIAIGVCLVALACPGCAVLPVPLNPQNEQYNSNTAEGAWLVLDALDTYQTMHIRKGTSCDHEADGIAAALYGGKYPKPGRVLATNVVLALGHTMITSWLDDEVAKHEMLNDDSDGPWYTARVLWHVTSILATGSSVVGNKINGCG